MTTLRPPSSPPRPRSGSLTLIAPGSRIGCAWWGSVPAWTGRSVDSPQLMSAYEIGRIGVLKADIEGGELAVFGSADDLC